MNARLRPFVVINQKNTSAPLDHSASIELADTNKGLLPNRLTTAQRDAIVDPLQGLTIYNTDVSATEIFNGSIWQTQLQASNNLSDLTNAAQARTNLGITTGGGFLTANAHVVITNYVVTTTNTPPFSIKMAGISDSRPQFSARTGPLGSAFVIVSGSVSNSIAGDTATIQTNYGTGTPPIPDAIVAGSAASAPHEFIPADNDQSVPFCIVGGIGGETPDTTFWIDLVMSSTNAVTIKNPSLITFGF